MSSAKLKSGANRETRGPWGGWTQPLSTPELPAHKSAQAACSFGRPANSARPPSGAGHRHTASMAKSSSNRAALSVLASRPSPSGEAPLYRSSPPRYGRGVRRSRGCPTTRRDLSDDDTTETEARTPNKSSFRCNSSADQPTDDQTDNAPSDGLNRLELHRRVPFLYRGDEPPERTVSLPICQPYTHSSRIPFSPVRTKRHPSHSRRPSRATQPCTPRHLAGQHALTSPSAGRTGTHPLASSLHHLAPAPTHRPDRLSFRSAAPQDVVPDQARESSKLATLPGTRVPEPAHPRDGPKPTVRRKRLGKDSPQAVQSQRTQEQPTCNPMLGTTPHARGREGSTPLLLTSILGEHELVCPMTAHSRSHLFPTLATLLRSSTTPAPLSDLPVVPSLPTRPLASSKTRIWYVPRSRTL